MKCPHCSVEIETPQARWQQQQRARGLCTRCGIPSDTWKCPGCTELDRIARQKRTARRKGYESRAKVHRWR